MAGVLFGTALLSALVTKLVDVARKLDAEDEAPEWLWIALSIAFGITIALIWQVDALSELSVSPSTRLQGISGQVLTGALVGGLGSGWHEAFDALSSAAKAGKKAAGLPVKERKRRRRRRRRASE